ncbi:hypothetical protein Tco_0060571 [Tanacetum coccineum]
METLNELSPLGFGTEGYTPGSDEGSKKLNELTELCIKLSKKGQTFKRSAQVYNKEEKGKETEHAEEVEYILEQITPSKGPQDLLLEKRLSKATPEEEVLTVQKLVLLEIFFSTAEEFLSTDEEIAQKLNEEEMTKVAAREGSRKYWKIIRVREVTSTEDMEKALWVELKRIFKPDKDDVLWKLQRYMHDPLTWRLYGSCAVH